MIEREGHEIPNFEVVGSNATPRRSFTISKRISTFLFRFIELLFCRFLANVCEEQPRLFFKIAHPMS